MQNSGVMLVVEAMYFSNPRDTNPISVSQTYYGVIEEIWEMMYTTFRVPIFKCRWVDNNNGVKTDDLGITSVNFNKVGERDEPFIMANQVHQVFYVKDPSVRHGGDSWSIVLQGRRMHNGSEESEGLNLNISETPPISRRSPRLNDENEADMVHATRNDHNKAVVENIYGQN